MKTYLTDFFKQFEYSVEDANYLLDVYEKIENSEGASLLWRKAVELYDKDFLCDKGDLLSIADEVGGIIGVHEYTLELLIYICLSKRLKEIYTEKGISAEVFNKSVLDLKYKLEECKHVYGVIGSFVAHWFSRLFELKLFGFGRLQFEVVPFDDIYTKNGINLTKTTNVINVHIPRSGEKLNEEACFDAYRRAKLFFKEEISLDPCPFVCDSWLLFPEHENILSKGSNVYKFFKSYEIISSRIDKNRNDLWRLFDTLEKNPDRLPSNGSLRNAYVKHLKNGGAVGTSRGILFV